MVFNKQFLQLVQVCNLIDPKFIIDERLLVLFNFIYQIITYSLIACNEYLLFVLKNALSALELSIYRQVFKSFTTETSYQAI